MIFAIFALIEVVVHLIVGFKALKAFKPQGKETIYFPGNFTSWVFFAPFSIMLIYTLLSNHLMTSSNWIWTIGILIVYFIFGFFWPVLGFNDHNSPYVYDEEPREGFYLRKYVEKNRK